MIDNLIVRLAEADDAEAIASIYAPVVRESATSFEEVAPTTGEMRERIIGGLRTYRWLVAAGPDVAGYAYAGRHRARAAYRWSVEVSAYVREDQRRRGIAKMLYATLFNILAGQRFHRAFAGIVLPNDASVALHRSLGFTEVGVFRWWQRRLNESGRTAEEPIAICSLDSALLARALS